jgi:hypothetical protein
VITVREVFNQAFLAITAMVITGAGHGGDSPTSSNLGGTGSPLLRELANESQVTGDYFRRTYSWTIEGLGECKSWLTRPSSSRILSGQNALAAALLELTFYPERLNSVGLALNEARQREPPADWFGPWQQSFCSAIDLDNFVDPVAAAMKPRGGEGGENCELSFAPIFCLMNDNNRVEQFTVYYASAEVIRLLHQELEVQRSTLEANSHRMTEDVTIRVSYENHLQAKIFANSRSLEISAILVRTMFVHCAIEGWNALRTDHTVASIDFETPEIVRAAMFAASHIRECLKEQFRFTLAHELAHIYLGDGVEVQRDESLVDCAAILQLVRSKAAVSAGVFQLLQRAYDEGVESYWGLSHHDVAAISQRSTNFQSILAVAEQSANLPSVESFCRERG